MCSCCHQEIYHPNRDVEGIIIYKQFSCQRPDFLIVFGSNLARNKTATAAIITKAPAICAKYIREVKSNISFQIKNAFPSQSIP